MRTVLAHTVVSPLAPLEVVGVLRREANASRAQGWRGGLAEQPGNAGGVDVMVTEDYWRARVHVVPHGGQGSVVTAEISLSEDVEVDEVGRQSALLLLGREMFQSLVGQVQRLAVAS